MEKLKLSTKNKLLKLERKKDEAAKAFLDAFKEEFPAGTDVLVILNSRQKYDSCGHVLHHDINGTLVVRLYSEKMSTKRVHYSKVRHTTFGRKK